MKQAFLIAALLLSGSMAQADDTTVILDLSKSTTALKFNNTNGSWTRTYANDATAINSQCFSFIHSAIAEYETWWGFTASVSTDTSRPENTMTRQWSNIAGGGIALTDNGEVKKDAFGAPVVSPSMPYLVAYYCPFMSQRPIDMVFTDGKAYEPQGVYLNNNTYPYYCIEYGDPIARAFTDGDDFTVTIHGVAPDGTEHTVEVSLASFSNGDLTINRGWKYVDLTSLGAVNELYFTMASTDSGVYGMNTPGYFCLDKLSVKPANTESLGSVAANTIRYNRDALTVSVADGAFATVSNIAGQTVMSGEGSIDISSLSAGVYIVRSGNHSLKIAR